MWDNIDRFMLIGPGIISGPWRADQYDDALQFAEDIQEMLGKDILKMNDWLLNWQDTGEIK